MTTGPSVAVGPLADIPVGEGRAYAIGGEQVAVFRLRDGSVRAVAAVCPHRGGPIADGQIDGDVVICPLHLGVFELESGCSRSDMPPLAVYACEVDEAGVVRLDPLPRGAAVTVRDDPTP